MTVSDNLQGLVAAVAPLFAGEAEVFRTYWDWPGRSRETDRQWILRQARKEVWDTPQGDPRGLYLGPVEDLLRDLPRIDIDIPRRAILERMETLYEEFSHYCAFADAYDALSAPGAPPLSPAMLREVPDWPENAAIRARRAEIVAAEGAVGARACFFTEGGYCTLFSEGMLLAGRGGADEAIARACALVYEDEFGHMLKGIVGLDAAGLAPEDWARLTALSVELAGLRIAMRNAQFGYPLSERRIAEIHEGKIEPIAFDFDRAAAE